MCYSWAGRGLVQVLGIPDVLCLKYLTPIFFKIHKIKDKILAPIDLMQ